MITGPLEPADNLTNIRSLFKKAGFRLIYVVKDNFYLLVPDSDDTLHKYGASCLPEEAILTLERELRAAKNAVNDLRKSA